jgi:hypothetical protein
MAFQNTDEAMMRRRREVAIMWNVPGLQLRAGDVRMDQGAWSAARLEPMDLFEVTQPRQGSTPTIPLALHYHQCAFIDW